MSNKKILIIAYLTPPAATPRAIRLEALASHWVKAGHTVDIVTVGDHVVETTSYGNLHRVTSKLLKSLTRSRDTQKAAAASGGKVSLKGWILSLISNLWWKVFAWPDGNCLWIFPAVKKAKELLKTNQYDAVMSISTPFSGHVAAYFALKKYKHLPWLTDSGDPFSLVPESPANNYYLYSFLNKSFERKILAHCDHFSITTEGTRKIYADAFPEYADKLVVIPPLYSSSKPVPLTAEEVRNDNEGTINIIFIGFLYRKMRNPSNALNIFIKLFERYPELKDRCRITFWGGLGDCPDIFAEYASVLPLSFCGPLPHSDVMNTMQKSSILLNLGNITNFQTPSKIIEYALSGRPVLNVSVIPDDSTVPYFAGDSTFLNLEGYKDITSDELDRLADFIAASPTASRAQDVLDRIWKNHNIDNIAAQYTALLNKRS